MFCSVLLSVWIVHFVRSKYFPHHPILEHLQPLFVRQLGRPSFKPPYAKSGVSIDLSQKSHPNNMLFAGKKNIYKNQPVQIAIQPSVCFSAFNTQTVRHVLKTLEIFSVNLRQMHYVLHEIITRATLQHFTSITCQHYSRIVNTWSVYWRKGYIKHVQSVFFSDQNTCIPLPYLNFTPKAHNTQYGQMLQQCYI